MTSPYVSRHTTTQKWHTISEHILPGVPVCSSGNICGRREWGRSDLMPCEPSSGASLLWTQESRQVENLSNLLFKRNLKNWFGSYISCDKKSTVFLPVKGSSSTRLQPLLLSKTLYLVAAFWDCRWARTLVTPSPASFILKRGLRAIWNLKKKKSCEIGETMHKFLSWLSDRHPIITASKTTEEETL